MGTFAAVVVGYLLGSALFGVIVPRFAGVDIYSVGSGNPGTANVARTVGKQRALLTVLGDIAKGSLAAAVGLWLGDADTVAYAAGLAAVLGHCFPVWRPLGGGKGVATAIGVFLVTSPWVGIGSLVLWGTQLAVTKVASAGSLILAVAWVPALAIAGERGWSLVLAAAIALLVLARHHENIRRLAMGKERRVG
ncbi:MAG: glycerol-3-phosphate 1-O-acyltransferase PlsY [Acidimicrobiia bacterium]